MPSNARSATKAYCPDPDVRDEIGSISVPRGGVSSEQSGDIRKGPEGRLDQDGAAFHTCPMFQQEPGGIQMAMRAGQHEKGLLPGVSEVGAQAGFQHGGEGVGVTLAGIAEGGLLEFSVASFVFDRDRKHGWQVMAGGE